MTNPPVCPLCQSQDSDMCFSENGYDLRACRGCDLLFIDPYPASADQVHDRVSRCRYEEKIEIDDPAEHYQLEVNFFRKYFPLIDRECNGATSVLDIGCGSGHLLERLSVHPNLYRAGIELDKARAEMARRVAGCDIYQLPIEEFTSDAKFDVITLINVLSHIPSFDDLFHSIQRLLSEKGKLILKAGEMKREVKKGDLFNWGIPAHMHFLGLDTINFICRKYGFEVSRHQRVPYSVELFSPYRWKSSGSTRLKSLIKQIIGRVPFALPIMAKIYDLTHGNRISSSFIVLSAQS